MKDLLDVTEDELKAIYKLGEYITYKWGHRTATREALQEYAYEVTSRYAELGFIINVDITPALIGVGFPDVAIVSKIDTSETDHERIRHGIKKRYKEEGRL